MKRNLLTTVAICLVFTIFNLNLKVNADESLIISGYSDYFGNHRPALHFQTPDMADDWAAVYLQSRGAEAAINLGAGDPAQVGDTLTVGAFTWEFVSGTPGPMQIAVGPNQPYNIVIATAPVLEAPPHVIVNHEGDFIKFMAITDLGASSNEIPISSTGGRLVTQPFAHGLDAGFYAVSFTDLADILERAHNPLKAVRP